MSECVYVCMHIYIYIYIYIVSWCVHSDGSNACLFGASFFIGAGSIACFDVCLCAWVCLFYVFYVCMYVYTSMYEMIHACMYCIFGKYLFCLGPHRERASERQMTWKGRDVRSVRSFLRPQISRSSCALCLSTCAIYWVKRWSNKRAAEYDFWVCTRKIFWPPMQGNDKNCTGAVWSGNRHR